MSKSKANVVEMAQRAGVRQQGKHVYLPVSVLEVDPETQRRMNKAWVKAHVGTFDPELFGEIVVSHRRGKYLVVDGQHRVELVRELGWHDQKIPCLVYEDLSLAEEAALFLGLGDRRQPTTFDKFRIAITAGSPVECDVDRIVRAQGLSLSDQRKDGAINAVIALKRVYLGAGIAKKESPAELARTLKILKAAWGPTSSSFEGGLILGVGMLLHRYNGGVDEPALINKLSKVSGGPSGVIARGKSVMDLKRRPEGHCMASVMVDIYNQGRRVDRLEDWWT